jgi:hypothetical protein
MRRCDTARYIENSAAARKNTFKWYNGPFSGDFIAMTIEPAGARFGFAHYSLFSEMTDLSDPGL